MLYVYILECSNSSYYIGYTTDIKRRYQEHVNGNSKCKYTRSFPPEKLAACWQLWAEKSDAMRLEAKLKKLSRHQKQQLVGSPERLANYTDINFDVFSETLV